MASVTSLDKDLRRLRLEKYTPAAADEAREWIEAILGDRLPSPDLLEGLRDGVALCRLINLVVPPPGVRFKKSAMPFVQMENISHFLRACQAPPLNLQQHDMFLTVDLYEQKDPAQVLQCIGAFSRAAHQANPAAFPSPIGPKTRGQVVSPQPTGPATQASSPLRGRGPASDSTPQRPGSSAAMSGFFSTRSPLVPHKTADSGSQPGRGGSPSRNQNQPRSPTPPGVTTSTWSKKEHEGSTAPAWNIAQYGYMGGASQGNLGIAFGGRRQITSPGPNVPSLAEKEKRRREKEAEEGRQREERRRQRVEEEERALLEEERRWEEETHRMREEERRRTEEEKRRWDEEERQWKITEERRRREDEEAEARLAQERARARSRSKTRLEGQYLSQYQAEHGITHGITHPEAGHDRDSRLRPLDDNQVKLALQREREYERERADRGGRSLEPCSSEGGRARPVSRQDSWRKNDDEVLTTPRASPALRGKSPRPLPDPMAAAAAPLPPRPLPEPPVGAWSPRPPTSSIFAPSSPAPSTPAPSLPPRGANNSPFARGVAPPQQSPPAQFPPAQARALPAQYAAPPQPTYSRELDPTAERDAEDRRRAQSQITTKAGGLASKSLLEREMELERQRQREWEKEQAKTAARVAEGPVDGLDGRWDVSQWSGFTGGDGQNRGSQGIGASRRPMVGPRP